MKSWNIGRAAALVAAGTLAACGAFAQNLPARIKIGSSQPLSGPTALNGQTARMVQEMTIKEINAAGGMGGRPVDLVFGDDQGDPTHAVTEVRRLVDQEKINVLIGPGVANVALASAPIVTPAKILSFPFTGAKSITVQNFPYGFATFYPSDAFAEAMVNYAIDKLGAKNIAIMADTGAQGRAAADTAKDYIPKRGGRVTGIEYADFDAQDYTPQVLNLKRGNPDVVLQVTSVQIGAGRFYLATEEQNWPVRIVSQVSSLFPEEIKKIAGANAYGARRLHGLTVKAVTMCPGEDPSRLPFVQFRDKLKAFTPDWQKIPLAIAPYYYDEMYITKAAVDATRSVDGPTLASWIEKNGGSVKGLILGPPTASATDHFLYHSEVFAFTVRPDQVNAQGVAVREGC